MAIKTNTNVKVDASAFLLHLKQFALVMGRDLGSVIKDQASKFCRDMVNYTPPFPEGSQGTPKDGDTLRAKRHGEDNIRNSVFKILRPIKYATAEEVADTHKENVFRLWAGGHGSTHRPKLTRWIKFQGKYSRGNDIKFIGAGDTVAIEQAHFKARDDAGHGRLKSYWRMKATPPMALVEKESDLLKYIKLRSQSVGRLKSTWYFASQKIGGTEKFPAWVTKAGAEIDAIAINQIDTPNLPSVTVGHKKGKKGMAQASERFIEISRNYRAYAMRNQMAYKLNKDKKTLWDISSIKMQAYFTHK